MFQEIEDLAVADKLAEAGLLWYKIRRAAGSQIVTWIEGPGFIPSYAQEQYRDYIFYILIEE